MIKETTAEDVEGHHARQVDDEDQEERVQEMERARANPLNSGGLTKIRIDYIPKSELSTFHRF
jgi:hypothetical protein